LNVNSKQIPKRWCHSVSK